MADLLDIRISVDYKSKPGVLRNLTLEVDRGEIVGLVGLSGSGKSTLSLAVLGLLDPRTASVRGSIRFQGRDLLTVPQRELRSIRGREIALVLQSPMAALNPSLTVGRQLQEVWTCHGGSPAAWRGRVRELLASVSLPPDDEFLKKYPRELSVGLAQRVLIAMAITHSPALLIADEPTSALDVITQSEILQLFARLSRDLEMAILFISHDLLSVAGLCDRVAILDGGTIVENGAAESIFQAPAHPFTKRLVAALPAGRFRMSV